uniref:Uncharacterized protein n=1 Tax=Polytomella parva TaxID=51329 RepID=A0A7S0UPT3_9CHLO|mmetsp:Transcript_13721/g.24195  ORF Transcript_13721/g.24195 Transcript_13721/m.24195 type:complete len:209 (+) Transcript_13721:272-898(+)
MDNRDSTFCLYYRSNQTSGSKDYGQCQSSTFCVDYMGPPLRLVGSDLRFLQSLRKPKAVTENSNMLSLSLPSYRYLNTSNLQKSTASMVSNNDSILPLNSNGKSLPSIGASAGSQSAETKKDIIWDGLHHYVVDVPKNSSPGSWRPPRIRKEDLQKGLIIGARELPGAEGVRLVGGKYRYLPSLGGSQSPDSVVGFGTERGLRSAKSP